MFLKMSEGCRAILICIFIVYTIIVFMTVAILNAPISMSNVYGKSQDLYVEVMEEEDDFFLVRSLEEKEYIPIHREQLYKIPKSYELKDYDRKNMKKDEIIRIYFDWRSLDQDTKEIKTVYLRDLKYRNMEEMDQRIESEIKTPQIR